MNDTIAAISTAQGTGAISIIRISGIDAIEVANKLTMNKTLIKAATHTIHYSHIVDKNEIIDEVLISIMKAPKTFTTEDIVEINCHGGIATTNKVLELILRNGARLAEPGEFTKRAFLNGRIDLIHAESIMDLINVKTEEARKIAIQGLEGSVSQVVKKLRHKMMELLASIEVNIDYPEYEDIEIQTSENIREQVKKINVALKNIIIKSEEGQIILNGIKTVIIGRPNVGKSSILNRLLREDKAIVTEIEGTTRDIVEGNIKLEGVLLHVIDTAGIRDTTNIVEKIGVEKSISLIEDADLIILVLNNNEPLSKEDLGLLEKTEDRKTIIVINKNDLESKIDRKVLENRIFIESTTTTEEGINELKEKIKELFKLDMLEEKDYNLLSNIRQISLAKNAYKVLEEVEKSLIDQMPIDILEIDIKKAWNILGEITGETYTEELIDQLFSQFCLGK